MRKLVILAVVLALVLGIAGVASAETQQGAATRLQALGILQGDEGGLRLGDNITRAEFAKIAVYLAGMEKSADVLKSTPSQFTDVKSGEWYTGLINVAAAQGFVKGDPNGTFRPNDNITYQEVITVVMRVLGYDDRLPGNWPADYLARADQIGLTDDVTFDAAKPAVRGDVAILASAALDTEWVAYDKAASDLFEEQGESLLEKNFDYNVVKDAFVTDWSYSNGRYSLTVIYDYDDDGSLADETRRTVIGAKKFAFSGADDIDGLKNHIVQLVLNNDDEIVAASVKDYKLVSDTEQDNPSGYEAQFELVTVAGTKIKNDDKTYNVAGDALIINSAGTLSTWDAYQATLDDPSDGDDDAEVGDKVSAERIILAFNNDDEVQFIRLDEQPRAALVDTVNTTTKRITTKYAGATPMPTDLNSSSKTYIVYKDGKPAQLSDIQENDLVTVTNGGNGYDYRLDVTRNSVSGKLSTVEYTYTNSGDIAYRINVGGTKYYLDGANTRVSKDGGDSDWSTDRSQDGYLNDLTDENVTIYLDAFGKVQYVIGDTEGAGANALYGVVTKANHSYRGNGLPDGIASLKIIKPDGKETTYVVSDDSSIDGVNGDDYANIATTADALVGKLVEYDLADDGSIDNLTALDGAANTDVVTVATGLNKDDNRIKLDGDWYNATSSTVVFDAYDLANRDASANSWSAFEKINATGGNVAVAYKVSGNKLLYLAVTDQALTSAADYAVVTEKGTDSKGKYLKLNVKGTTSRYDADDFYAGDAATYNAIGYKSIVSFEASGSDLTDLDEVVDNSSSNQDTDHYVDSIDRDGNAIKIDGDWYYVDDDTIFFDVTSSPKVITFSDLNVGDRLVVTDGDAISDLDFNADDILDILVVKNPS